MTNTARTKGRKETPLYLFLLVHFATSLVEDGLIVHQFVLTHHHTEHTEFLCRYLVWKFYALISLPMVIIFKAPPCPNSQ